MDKKKKKRPMRRKWERKNPGRGYNDRKIPNYARKEPKHDFLKYLRVARYWVKKNYDLSLADLEMLLFLYSERLFTKEKFKEYMRLFKWDNNKFYKLKNKGYISVWRKHNSYKGRAALYEVSHQGKRIITGFYSKLAWEEIYAETGRNNAIFKKDASYTDNMYKDAILNINEEIKERLQHPSQE
jgi:hypothetical protein